MSGILYKVCMLENADIEDDEFKKPQTVDEEGMGESAKPAKSSN